MKLSDKMKASGNAKNGYLMQEIEALEQREQKWKELDRLQQKHFISYMGKEWDEDIKQIQSLRKELGLDDHY